MRTLHLLTATCRPEMFQQTYLKWLHYAYHSNLIRTKIAVDCEAHKKQLELFDVMVVDNPKGGVGKPAFDLTTSYDVTNPGDIIIFMSDDFCPVMYWDKYLLENIDENIPTAFIINDGIQRYNSHMITLPILNHAAFIKLNKIIYHKNYYHLWADVELYNNCKNMIKLDNQNADIWKHNRAGHDDEYDKRNEGNNKIDQATYQLRSSWTLEDRLK